MADSQALSIGLDGLEEGTVISRPNRFVAVVRVNGDEAHAHVADSGRLKELIFPGNTVLVRKAFRSARATSHDLVLARGTGSGAGPVWVSVDTRYPNRIFGQALNSRALSSFAGYGRAEAEFWYHNLSPWKEEAADAARQAEPRRRPVRSRMDFYLPGDSHMSPGLVEVKSVTLCRDRVGYFPDAPTDRGARHLRELSRGAREGYRAFAVFIAQREDVDSVRPNRETDPAFADCIREAREQGVQLLGFRCSVTPKTISLDPRPIPVIV